MFTFRRFVFKFEVPHPKSLDSTEKSRKKTKKQVKHEAKKTFCANYLVKEVAKGLVAFALVADLRGRHPAGARVDVGRAVFLACIIQVACFGGVQAVVLFGGCRFS